MQRTAQDQPLPADLSRAAKLIRDRLASCGDVVFRPFAAGGAPHPTALLVYCSSMVDDQLIDEQALEALLMRTQPGLAALAPDPADQPTGTPHPAMTLSQAVSEILAGHLLMLAEGRTGGVVFRFERNLGRSVTEPVVEATIRGPREGFVEDARANLTLIRRRLQTPSFRLEWMRVGTKTTTAIALVYLDGVADRRVVRRARQRVRRIRIDGIIDSGYVEELIEDAPYSPFPTVAHTERPDRVAAGLLEGQVALVTSGSPQVLLVPTVLVQLLHSPEDYYERYMVGTATRALRLLSAFLALTLPSAYVAVTTFHHEMIPAPLFQAIAAQREGVPWPAVMEAFLMEITFELLREAGIRLPKPVGQAVSIIGGLVIGEAAIRARIASAGMIIIVAMTGIASYAVPAYNLSVSLRLIRFPLMMLAAVLGLHGVMVGLLLLLIHLLSLRSFGLPYLSPIMPPKWPDWQDVIFRAPWWKMGGRR